MTCSRFEIADGFDSCIVPSTIGFPNAILTCVNLQKSTLSVNVNLHVGK